MNMRLNLLVLLAISVALGGCTGFNIGAAEKSLEMSMANESDEGETNIPRMLIWKAFLTIEVSDVIKTAKHVEDLVKESKGYIESKSENTEISASLVIRIPSNGLNDILKKLESLGDVTHKTLSSEDVTEFCIDIEARLKNKRALCARMRELLKQATDVQDILAIEKELSRVQSDLDSMEGRLKALKGQVNFATINVTLRREEILGPLGYLFTGVWWLVEKLFVIQD